MKLTLAGMFKLYPITKKCSKIFLDVKMFNYFLFLVQNCKLAPKLFGYEFNKLPFWHLLHLI